MKSMSVLICIPNNNIAERSYIIKVLFDIIACPYELEIRDELSDYIIKNRGYELVIEDAFFSKHPEPLSYLKLESICREIEFLLIPGGGKIPIIYGNNKLIFSKCSVCCGLDIFASSFFMLTRWEELVIEKKDRAGRCDEKEMLVVKENIYQCPIVNEYIEFLKELLELIGITAPVDERNFSPFITHDVDDLFRYGSLRNFCKNLGGDLLHRRSLKTFMDTCISYVQYQRGNIKDPFDMFDELMNVSDKYGFKNAFYFIPSIPGEYDCYYNIFDERVKLIMEKIIRRGHEVGFHPSRSTYHNKIRFDLELERLRSIFSDIKGGRQHFLLYDINDTLKMWSDDNELKYDSGLGFASYCGFRCGICYPYPMFDVMRRRMFNLIVRPLIVMDVALLQKKSAENMGKEIERLIDVVYKYRGEFVFLWHNDNFNRAECLKYRHVYVDVLAYLGRLCNKGDE